MRGILHLDVRPASHVGVCLRRAVPSGPVRCGGSKGPKATVGSRRRLVVGAKDISGKELTSSRMATVRRQRAGDRAGKPLGC